MNETNREFFAVADALEAKAKAAVEKTRRLEANIESAAKRARAAYDKSAKYLIEANESSERGHRERSERLYERSTQWLMTFNEIVEKWGFEDSDLGL